MTTVLRSSAVLASCALVAFWSAPLMSGSEAHASGSSTSGSSPPSTSTSYSVGPDQFSVTVSPTRLSLGPNDLGTVQRILIVNRGLAPVSITVEKRNFTGGLDGSLVFQSDAPFSAANWVTIAPTSFEVVPGATQTVTASIAVPVGPEPGDHQVALVFLVPAGQTTANIKINRGVAAPIYITVAGPTDDSVSIGNLSAPGFAMGGPITLSAQVHDTGTVHRDFRGASSLAVNGAGHGAAFPDFTVMRGSTRNISTTLSPPLMCVCHATVSIPNAHGVAQSVTVRVIVFPLLQLGVVVGALVLILLAVWLGRRRYRSTVATAATRPHRPAHDGTP